MKEFIDWVNWGNKTCPQNVHGTITWVGVLGWVKGKPLSGAQHSSLSASSPYSCRHDFLTMADNILSSYKLTQTLLLFCVSCKSHFHPLVWKSKVVIYLRNGNYVMIQQWKCNWRGETPSKDYSHMPFVGYSNWLKNGGGQWSAVVQDWSLYITAHLMGGLK